MSKRCDKFSQFVAFSFVFFLLFFIFCITPVCLSVPDLFRHHSGEKKTWLSSARFRYTYSFGTFIYANRKMKNEKQKRNKFVDAKDEKSKHVQCATHTTLPPQRQLPMRKPSVVVVPSAIVGQTNNIDICTFSHRTGALMKSIAEWKFIEANGGKKEEIIIGVVCVFSRSKASATHCVWGRGGLDDADDTLQNQCSENTLLFVSLALVFISHFWR